MLYLLLCSLAEEKFVKNKKKKKEQNSFYDNRRTISKTHTQARWNNYGAYKIWSAFVEKSFIRVKREREREKQEQQQKKNKDFDERICTEKKEHERRKSHGVCIKMRCLACEFYNEWDFLLVVFSKVE